MRVSLHTTSMGDLMERMRLSMVSMNTAVGDIEGNLGKILSYSERAVSEGSDLVCFPELSLTGYSTDRSPGLAMGFDDPHVQRIVDASSELGIAICFGFVEDGPYITQAVAEDGVVKGSYRKTHLGEREAPVFKRGDTFPVIQLDKARIGVQTCWESHFPQITASYAFQGADIVLMPHASGLGGERRRVAWNKVIPARAYDNTVFVAACNMYGDNGYGVEFGGGVSVADVRGNILAEDYSGECMVTVDLDPTEMDRIRAPGYESMRDLYFLDKVRPDIYIDRQDQ